MLKKMLPLLLCLLLCGCARQQVQTEPAAAEPPSLSRIINACGKDPARAESLAKQLKAADPELGEKAEGILEYWNYVNNEAELNPILPDGLPEDDSLCILVLGYQLEADGSIRPELEGRLKTALASAEKYPNAFVLCTGGGTARDNREVTEAGQMAKWLVGNGLAPERLIVEDRSMTTAENAYNSFEILTRDYPQITAAAIVTSDYHIPWGAVLFQAQFLLGDSPIRIQSNAAFPTSHNSMDIVPYQLSGLSELLRLNGV